MVLRKEKKVVQILLCKCPVLSNKSHKHMDHHILESFSEISRMKFNDIPKNLILLMSHKIVQNGVIQQKSSRIFATITPTLTIMTQRKFKC